MREDGCLQRSMISTRDPPLSYRGVHVDRRVHDEAVELLEKIRAILDDDSLSDPECFHRIDAMVDSFQTAGVPTARHDW